MGERTEISWTDHTFNPWMGCAHVSPGCDHCYAESLGKRTGKVQWGESAVRVVTSEGYWQNPVKWNAKARADSVRRRVFCASLADVFEARPELEQWQRRLWALIEETPWLDWLLLTKRPQNVMSLVPASWLSGFPGNVWVGTTVEDADRALERIPVLAEIPAVVRFLSCEPLLGPIAEVLAAAEPGSFDWVIAGGESGGNARPVHPLWFSDLRDVCLAARPLVAFHFKQWGGRTPKARGRLLDGRTWDEFPITRTPLVRTLLAHERFNTR